jgi:hypothetical protein
LCCFVLKIGSYVVQAGLGTQHYSASAFSVLGLQARSTTPTFIILKITFV